MISRLGWFLFDVDDSDADVDSDGIDDVEFGS